MSPEVQAFLKPEVKLEIINQMVKSEYAGDGSFKREGYGLNLFLFKPRHSSHLERYVAILAPNEESWDFVQMVKDDHGWQGPIAKLPWFPIGSGNTPMSAFVNLVKMLNTLTEEPEVLFLWYLDYCKVVGKLVDLAVDGEIEHSHCDFKNLEAKDYLRKT